MKTKTRTNHCLSQLAVSLAFASLVTGCATNQTSPKQVQLTHPTTEKPVVAVLPFDNSKQYQEAKPAGAAAAPGSTTNAAAAKGGSPGDVKKFEKTFFTARLINTLRSNSAIGNAYFTTNPTPGADFNVAGRVKKSDGKMTVIALTIKSADGKKLWSNTFSVNTTSAQYRPKVDPSAVLWAQAAAAIAKIPQKPGQFAASRTIGYANNAAITVNDKRASTAGEAASVERQQMLEPVTKKLLTYAPTASDKYLLWQKESTPLVEARSAEKVQTGINVGLQILSAATMAGGAYTGNSFATQAAGQNMISASNNIQVSAAKIQEINKTLVDASRAFDEYKGGSLTVRIFGTVYQLHGSLAQQQNEFCKIVAEQLAKVEG